MSIDLPEGWAEAKLGDLLVRIEAGRSFACEPRRARADEWGIIKVSAMTWGAFDESENKAVPEGHPFEPGYEIHPGDLLVSRANTEEYVGAPVLVGECRPKLLLSDKSLRLVPGREVDRKWLLYVLSSPAVRGEISRRSTGTKESMRNISQNALSDITLPVPPVNEQRRIVVAIEERLSRLEYAEKLLMGINRKISIFRSSRLQDIFCDEPGGLRRWPRKRLADVARVQGGQTPRKDSISFLSAPTLDSVPFWKVGDMNGSSGRYMVESRTYVALGDVKLAGLRVQPAGVVLIPKRGGAIATNKKRISKISGCYDLNTMGIVPSSDLDSGFLWYWMESLDLRDLADGTNVPQINNSDLVDLMLPVPELSEQRRVVETLDEEFSALERVRESAGGARSAQLTTSLLAEAFAGRLVAPNPEDEPALEFLDRIKVERSATSSRASARGRRNLGSEVRSIPPARPGVPKHVRVAPPIDNGIQTALDLEIF